MSRIGKKPITVPTGVDVTIDGRHVAVKGPKGTLEHDVPETITVTREGDELARHPPRRRARAPGAARPHPLAGRQHGRRRVGRLQPGARDRRRRLPRRRRRARPSSSSRSASPTRSRSTRPRASTFEVPAPTRITVRGHRQAARRPGGRRHPQDPQARALQGQGHPLRRTSACCARPASQRSSGRGIECEHAQPQVARNGATAGSARRSAAPRRGRASRCSVRTSTSTPRSSTTSRDAPSRRRRRWSRSVRAAPPAPSPRPRRSASCVGERAKSAGIETVVFDRGGFKYHGRVAAVADGAREAGLEF